jgi:L-2,4-diaminobutyrate decarboxylase
LLASDRLRPRLRGIEKADSMAWDAHKMMFMPAVCTMLFYRQKEASYGAFRQNASYVFEKQPDIYSEFESAEQNFECTKRPLIMPLWVCWSIYGQELFAQKIEYLCGMTHRAWEILDAEPDFEVIHEPDVNILCFRYVPENLDQTDPMAAGLQVDIRTRMRGEGRFFISKVDIDGQGVLRVVFMNHLIGEQHFRDLLDEIRHTGQALISEHVSQRIN